MKVIIMVSSLIIASALSAEVCPNPESFVSRTELPKGWSKSSENNEKGSLVFIQAIASKAQTKIQCVYKDRGGNREVTIKSEGRYRVKDLQKWEPKLCSELLTCKSENNNINDCIFIKADK